MTAERGMATAVEVALLVPVLLLVCLSVIVAWRVWWVKAQVQSATAAAARAAVRASSLQAGRDVAAGILQGDLAASEVACTNADVLDGSSQFAQLAQSPGESGTVVVQTTCVVSLSTVVIPGFPGSVTLHASATEAIDTYGERQP